MGYADSSSLYSFAGGDPVNSRDPLGLAARRVGDEGGGEEEAPSAWKRVRQAASVGLGVVPILGEVLDAAQVVTGYDIIAGERLSAEDRAIAAAALLIPGASASVMRYGAKGLRAGSKMLRHADELADVAEAIAKRGDDVAGAGKRGARNADEMGSVVQSGAKRTARREAQQEAAERAGRQMEPQSARVPEKPVKCEIQWNCFATGTLVATEEGAQPIETIEAGDEVWATGAAGEAAELGRVAALFSREVSEVWVVETANTRVETTDEHPFWVDGAGWTQASDVREGDDLKTKAGTLERVTAVRRDKRTAKVLNFEVAGYHNYFVSNAGLLVHNCAKNWREYERRVNAEYGEVKSPRARTYVSRGKVGVADNIVVVDNVETAVEAKFVKNWEKSIRNPNSPLAKGTVFKRGRDIARRERKRMVEQAKKYSNRFESTIYHSNSQQFIDYYSRLFRKHGIQNIQFKLTK